MTPPRVAFGATPPGGRHQRPGKAGSAASAWLAAVRRVAGLLVLAGVSFSAWAGEAQRTPLPVIEKAAAGTTCVADPATMRRTHMDLLKHQRNDTVHAGVRTGAASLKGCIDCHASQQTRSVTQGETNFCVSCHTYAAVKIDCFECHSNKARAGMPAAQTVGAK